MKNVKNNSKQIKRNKGITLIALVVTIVVLIILAGVTISVLIGENGIVSQAQKAKEETIKGDEKEAVSLAYASCKTNNMMDRVTDKQLQQELKNNGRDVTVTTITENELEVSFNKTNHVYIIDENGNIEKYVPSEKNRIYATSYCKEILALANNSTATDEAEKYRKYFDDLRVENREESLINHANAVSNYIIAYARNPSFDNRFIEILEKLTYKGEISQKNYTPVVQAEYLKNAGALMRAGARNPSLIPKFVDIINEYNPYVTAPWQDSELFAELTYNKDLEEVKAAREEVLGDKMITCANNPSLRPNIIDQFNKLVAIDKNVNPSAKEQAEAVKAIGKTICGYAHNPPFRDHLFGFLEDECSLIKDETLEEVQVARAETLEMLIAAIYKNPSLQEEILNYYNHYIGLPPEKTSPKVQAISLYNSGNLLEVLRICTAEENEKILKNYEKVNINITENTDEIQAASLANLGKLYWTLPFTEENVRSSILEFFRTKLYKEITSNSPIIQAAKYYSYGYYDSAYQEIMKIEDKTEREGKLKILKEIKQEFEPNVEIDYKLEEVQIAKIEFLNTIYDSYYTAIGGRYFIQKFGEYEGGRPLQPSEEYFAKK